MGYGYVPDMTDENLVCQKPCKHTDCAANRKDFVKHADCVICGKPLLAGQAFYYHGEGKYDKAHAACAQSQVV